MTRRLLFIAASAMLLSISVGCITECHHSAKSAILAGPSCESPYCDRQHVYIVMLNGLTPELDSGLVGLRDQLAAKGFSKIYYGQLFHAWWIEMEMKRIAKEDPSARFMVIGYDISCTDALGMAEAVQRKGVIVESVVLIDPIAMKIPEEPSIPILTIRSGDCKDSIEFGKSITISDAGHFTFPTNEKSQQLLLDLLKQIASRVVHPPVYEMPALETKFAPPPDRNLKDPGDSPEWSFLADIPSNYQPTTLISPTQDGSSRR